MKTYIFASILVLSLPSAFFNAALGADKPADTTAGLEQFVSSHRPFWFFTAAVEDGKVHLNFSKSHWYHYNSENYDFSDVFNKIRIYRKTLDYNWNWDRTEVLDGLICSLDNADVIFEGFIEPKYGKVYDYYDNTVQTGQTYAYFVSGGQSPATGPAAVKVRDSEVLWSKEKIAAELRQLKERYPEMVKVQVAGKSHRGNDILAATVGKGGKKVALIGAVHASESGPELIVAFLKTLLESHQSPLTNATVLAIPCVNIDERNRVASGYPFYLRRNVVNVDLNRNFPADWEQVSYKYGVSTAEPTSGTYRGPAPASEPETQAVISFLQANKPDVLFSYHHLASVSGKCLWAPIAGEKDQAYSRQCMKIYDAFDAGYSSIPTNLQPADPAKKFLRFASTSGSLPAYCLKQFNIPAFDVERHWDNDGLDYSNLDQTTAQDLKLNQRQHAAALLKVIETMP